MKKRNRIGMIGLFLAFLLAFLSVPVLAESEPFPDTSRASAVLFYHLESDRLIGEQNADIRLPAGSTVKILSGLLFCERLGAQLGDEIEITAEMIRNSSGRRFRMQAGEIYTVEQLLYLAVCGSYNDAFDVLAYVIGGGDVRTFVSAMSERATELGLENTVIADHTGLSDSSFTTARDLFTLARVAVENSFYMTLCSAEIYDLPVKRIYNANALLSTAEETRYYNTLCRGLSAGSTTLGGYSLVTVAQKGNERYLCVVLGASKGEGTNGEIYSYEIANRLIDWGFSNFANVEVLSPDVTLCTIPITVSDMTESLEVRPRESLQIFLPKDAEIGRDVTYSIRLMYDSLEAPVAEGVHVGYVAVIYRGETVGTVNLYTVGTAQRSGLISRLLKIRSVTENRAILSGMIFFVLAMSAWLVTETLVRRYKRNKWKKYFSEKIDLPETLMKRKK